MADPADPYAAALLFARRLGDAEMRAYASVAVKAHAFKRPIPMSPLPGAEYVRDRLLDLFDGRPNV